MGRPHHLGQPVIAIHPATPADSADWAALRGQLWPGDELPAHMAEIARALADPHLFALIVRDGEAAVGFAEASLRHDYVNGCDTSPVAFLEGIYVAPGHRRRGIARLMVAAIAAWGEQRGCRELASDAGIDNLASQQMHEALGFSETERVVYFRKRLG
jgi:aminoglycoside 6'-N-acetyltransferase I